MTMMSDIKHHLNDELLMAYAAGTLPEAFNLMVAAHISLCDECRAIVESYEALGGAVIEQGAAEVALEPDAFAQTMSLIAGGAVDEIRMPRKAGVLPGPLQDYVGGDLEAVNWRSVGLGVKQAVLQTDKDASARLLFIPAGAAMPDHGHHGIEMTMVLQGAFKDEQDYFARGDVEIADPDVHHTPIADEGMDCICLAVTDAPLRFDGLLPKIAQRFVGI